MGLNGETGELFALKEIEIRAMPSADTVKQMHKLGEEISLMKNLSHKHIVRCVPRVRGGLLRATLLC